MQYLKRDSLASKFLKSQYYKETLLEFSEILLQQLGNGGLAINIDGLFKGYFQNFIFKLVNDNSDTHYLFDEILAVSIKADHYVSTRHIIRTMAEIGHKQSRLELGS